MGRTDGGGEGGGEGAEEMVEEIVATVVVVTEEAVKVVEVPVVHPALVAVGIVHQMLAVLTAVRVLLEQAAPGGRGQFVLCGPVVPVRSHRLVLAHLNFLEKP